MPVGFPKISTFADEDHCVYFTALVLAGQSQVQIGVSIDSPVTASPCLPFSSAQFDRHIGK